MKIRWVGVVHHETLFMYRWVAKDELNDAKELLPDILTFSDHEFADCHL